jgi:hypothetical protein
MSGKKLQPHGERVSKPSAPRSKVSAADPHHLLKKLLAAAYNQYQKIDDPKQNAACRRDFVFHMMDWIKDLESLSKLYQHPEKFDKAEASVVVAGFLYHATWHVRAAARLMLDFGQEDIFETADGCGEPQVDGGVGTLNSSPPPFPAPSP